jgi:hypothetical protein
MWKIKWATNPTVQLPSGPPKPDPEWMTSWEAMRCQDAFASKFERMVEDLAMAHSRERDARDSHGNPYIELEDVQYAGNYLISMIKETKSDVEARHLCPGCSRTVDIMKHKWCPAYGTEYYMSGKPLPEGMERSPLEFRNDESKEQEGESQAQDL